MRNAMLTIDLGTTRLKVAAFAGDGALLSQETARNEEHASGAHAWQDADAWWRDTLVLARRVRERLTASGHAVVAISISGRGGAGVFTNGKGDVLVQPWSDDRHRGELSAIRAIRTERGAPSPYAAALLAKYLWIARQSPERRAQIARAFYAKDFLLFRLTGEHATDPSSGPDGASWDAELLAQAGVSEALLPRPEMPWHVAGGLLPTVAHALGLPAGLPVVVGAHDGICANVGAGAARPATVVLTLGTHAVVRTVLEAVPPGARRFYTMPPNRHVIGGNAFMGGRSADWFIDVTTGEPLESRMERFRALDAEASTVAVGAEGAMFLPFLGGRLAPEFRPNATAAFLGMRAHHRRAHLYRALLEGVAFAIGDVFDQVCGWCGAPRAVRVTGGGATSDVWLQMIANVLRTPLEVTDGAAEGRGAAIFAAVALGLHADYELASHRMVNVGRRIEPDPTAAPHYETARRRWLDTVRQTRTLDSP